MKTHISSITVPFSDLPIQFPLGSIQHLHTLLIRKAPIHTGLLGLANVTGGVVHAHPAHLSCSQVVWEKAKGEMGSIFCSIMLIQPSV